ncbi:CGNR zinc finger domain-containing protein [Microlunatus flavus]|uniref:CGNR zinc finger domain-containing protein n=1 Tax=Microlunatus flavus TaxID=1036181 RepID=A0A1H9HDW7_9ACTN|nr:CGNR zinc finger domain-containing protein [Microlunatus flavus]SEQ60583.1 CGNR zinc finger domain-containing protein [Microlunatus flavus]
MMQQPGGRQPAPAHLQPLQDLLNTVDLESEADELAAARFAAWAGARGVTDAGEDDRVRLQRLREDLRAWVGDHAERVPGPVEAAVAHAALRVEVVDGRLRTTSATPFGRLVADVVEGVREAVRVDDWKRLKICSRSSCRWAFYDHSRNNSSRWCHSTICGAREKSMRAYRKRAGRADERGRPA